MPLWQRLCLPALGGICYALGNIGYGLWPLALICLLPLWRVLLTSQLTQWRHAFASGMVFGLAIYLSGFHWLFALTDQFVESGPVAFFLWGLTGLLFASGYAVYTCTIHFLRRFSLPIWAALCLPLLLIEWWQVNLFPAYLGLGLIEQASLSQLASLGGPLLLSAFALWLNVLCYRAVFPKDRQQRVLILAQMPLPFLLCIAYTSMQAPMATKTETDNALRVGLIQNNVVKLETHQQNRLSHQRNLELSRALLAEQPVDLLIWPESSYTRALRRPLPLDAQFIRQDISTPLLFGGTSNWHHPGQGRAATANSIFLVDDSGSVTQVYDKQNLIPFAESVPFIEHMETLRSDYLALLLRYFPWHQSFQAGPENGVITLGNFRIATPICYEMILPGYVRDLVNKEKANLIVSIANDAWFGESQEPWIHLALSRLRAIEHGLWVVRATNSGISAIINPRGEIEAQTGLFSAETLTASVQARQADTLYSRFGDWVGVSSLLLLLAWLLPRLMRRYLLQGLPARSHH
ncbi:MAG: apolipoprotein N-acyltransferase [Oleiphilus sp.]|nr:MAG: apolipoprotein N-acyltransferase [Oleiphilus sp.]